MPASMPPERSVRFRPRVILTMAALIVGVGARPVGGVGVAPRPGLDARVGVPAIRLLDIGVLPDTPMVVLTNSRRAVEPGATT